jgi:hypothetical protein
MILPFLSIVFLNYFYNKNPFESYLKGFFYGQSSANDPLIFWLKIIDEGKGLTKVYREII